MHKQGPDWDTYRAELRADVAKRMFIAMALGGDMTDIDHTAVLAIEMATTFTDHVMDRDRAPDMARLRDRVDTFMREPEGSRPPGWQETKAKVEAFERGAKMRSQLAADGREAALRKHRGA